MRKLFSKKYLTLGLIVMVALTMFVSTSGSAHAQTANELPNSFNCLVSPATCTIYYLTYYVSTIIGWFVSFGAWLIQLGLQLAGHVYDSPVVQSGFAATLGFANLGFVLVIIIIAIATILRMENYGIKKMLWRLIVMAVIINFGLVITAPLVGLSNDLTTYFVNSVNGGTQGISAFMQQFSTAVSPAAADRPPANTPADCARAQQAIGEGATGLSHEQLQQICLQSTQSPSASFSKSLLALVFAIVFKGLIVITFFLLGLLLFVRYVYLTVLLVLLPFAWLSWIFPSLSKEFSKWWQKFIHWTFFPPAAMFFVWLALYLQRALVNGQSYLTLIGQTGVQGAPAQNDPVTSLVVSSAQYGSIGQLVSNFIVLGVMIGGLTAASSLAGKTGSWAISQGKNVSNAVTGYVGRKSKRVVGDRVRTAGRKYDSTTGQTTTGLQRFGSKLQAIPGFKRAGAVIARENSLPAIQGKRAKDIEDYINKELKSLTNDGIVSRAGSAGALVDPVKAAALAQELAKRDLTTHPKVAPSMDKFVNAAERMGNLEKVTANRPDLMPVREKSPGVMETREEAAARAIKSAKGDITNATGQIFNLSNPAAAAAKLGPHVTPNMIKNAVLALTPAQLGAIGSDTSGGSQARQSNLNDAVKDLVRPFKVMNASGKFELDTAALATAAAAPGAAADLKNLERIVKHMESSPNWGSVLN
jgi:hypothetical protein